MESRNEWNGVSPGKNAIMGMMNKGNGVIVGVANRGSEVDRMIGMMLTTGNSRGEGSRKDIRRRRTRGLTISQTHHPQSPKCLPTCLPCLSTARFPNANPLSTRKTPSKLYPGRTRLVIVILVAVLTVVPPIPVRTSS